MDHLVVVTTTQASTGRRPCLARIIMAASVVVWRLSVCRCPPLPLPLWMHLRRASCEVRAPSSRLPETLRLQFALCLSDRCGGTAGLQGDYTFKEWHLNLMEES